MKKALQITLAGSLFTIEEDVVLVTHVHHQSRDRINVELGPEHDGP